MKILQHAFLATIALIAATGCGPKQQAKSLKDVQVPPGFTFQTTRGVEVALTSSEAVLPGGKAGHLILTRPDGKILYDGFLTATGERKVRLSLPSKDQALVATLETSTGNKLRAELPVSGGTAVHRFE